MALLKIKSDARPDLGYILIDEKDFDKSIHQKWSSKKEKQSDESITDPHGVSNSVSDFAPLPTQLNINAETTGVEVLMELEGVGKSTAEQIINMRNHTPLTLEQLQARFPRIKWQEFNLVF